MKRLGSNCPPSRDLWRDISCADGGAASRRVRDHAKNCESCRGECASLARLAALSRMLPYPGIAPDELEAVRTALLVEYRRPRQPILRAPWWSWAPVVALLVAAGAWLIHERDVGADRLVGPDTPARSGPAKLHRGRVHPDNSAVFSLMQGQPDEVVLLRQGEVTVEVEHLAENERFRVVTGDAAVEVKGTVFSVTAAEDRLVAVSVTRGQVVVRVLGHDSVTLGPNERWDRSLGERKPRSSELRDSIELFKQRNGASPQSGRTPERRLGLIRPDHQSPEASGTPNAAETAFTDGWEALRSQRLADAAVAFSRAIDAAGDQPLSEDAWFWLAVCQARIPRPAEARTTLAAFIVRFPHSPRIGEAADMLGWLLIDSGDVDGAERAFATAALGSGASVRRSAKEGLRAVQIRRRAMDYEVPRQ